ncbi:MAG TPA: polyprenyl diphosphate synthase [bacterium]|nr:polyprenyl diphosphate synthase [bacterium]
MTASQTDLLKKVLADPERLPRHVGVVLDGNRRWAKANGLSIRKGYEVGAKKCEELLHWAHEAGIRIISIWVWSTENFKRSQSQVNFMMKLFKTYMRKALKDHFVPQEQTRIKFIGRLDMMNSDLQLLARDLEEETKDNRGLQINVCMAYGGRNELVDAARHLAEKVKRGELRVKNIDEKALTAATYYDGPDIDLVIRTSGEQRTSGFMLWHTAYSEWYFEKKHFPDLEKKDFLQAIYEYQQRDRRFGR